MRIASHVQFSVAIDHSSQIGYARREAMAAARDSGLSVEQTERVALICTEMASNIAKHAGGNGEVVIRRLSEATGMELLALDRGPGLDVPRQMVDRQSTTGSLGTGLGAIRRLSDVFDIHVGRQGGTAILSQIFAGPRPQTGVAFGVVCLPLNGHPVCGDGWALAIDDGAALLLLVDGLGHGLHASDVARQAEHVFVSSVATTPLQVMEALHAGLAGMRGAVGMAVGITPSRGTAAAAGVGNIAGRLVGDEARRLLSYPGTLGVRMRHCQEVPHEWAPGTVVVLHSDGLSQRWEPPAYPGLWHRHPALIAGVLYRDFRIASDDACVAVLAMPGTAP